MKLSDFDFDLPEDLIATRPVRPRPAARMLLAEGDRFSDRHVQDLPAILRAGDLLVINTTRVIPARLTGQRPRNSAQGPVSAKVEVTLTEPHPDGSWRALAKPLRKLAPGDAIVFTDTLNAHVVAKTAEDVVLRFNLEGDDFDLALDVAGQMPLPPYIAGRRAADAQDRDDYQTVFARDKGAVAAPTASLHFDVGLMDALRAHGVQFAEVTLHVGAGTFLPVKADDIRDHKMHAEWGRITAPAVKAIMDTKAAGGRVIPVGTTALRLLETAATAPGRIAPWSGKTDIFITPGFHFRIADGLMTNFHLPKSTLMMLVSALMGQARIRAIYAHAIAARYRFFSYGDSSLLLPD
ncbi:tRNA preQ1(34) S-adenosylmethionine ribosyltransferase-isomerase QueA [Roseinatronobacter alkalisoli]|uniref:S-adenosylmethionine:tRNA ribosyltransferase-isomerase n=1 Tax=Roseinatronobacter alkalisoli TaxID=3028235 RepID=A0ABT5T5B3_9RHOB|nr:tRNA preQ1(34) S-adenosylmethionine ribosyltransferase-isomerase QueA [Roseinatronobacter sp. HJB301]MDD7969905.1 tRNA preQ1(34) S-adenosylmethionine ribosyltransferase-isomerase QueA [Roseinatronobacter sp. HJB301]